ncbi:MAG: hypothetical protein H0V01_01710 [Bacteroidetes bacterium]|nr:hypothetical protein [Bacteroidota bacterium]HET6243258.1 hypothetical protein [Bacteroidia bacterium]
MKNKKENEDKERDIALQTPDKGKKAKSKIPPDRAGTDSKKKAKKTKYFEQEDGESDAQGAHGFNNKIDKGEQGPQGYGKYKK